MSRCKPALSNVVIAATACFGLTACAGGGEPAPKFEAGRPLTASPTTKTAVTPPALPRTATQGTKAGASAFIEHFWSLANYAQRTGQTAPLQSVSSPGCAGCRGAIAAVRDVYDNGGKVEGGDYSILRATFRDIEPDARQTSIDRIFDVEITLQNRRQVVTVPGRKDVVYPQQRVVMSALVSHLDDAWTVDVLQTTKS